MVANVFNADHLKQNCTAGKHPALNSRIALRVHLQADGPRVGPKAVQVDLTTSPLTAAFRRNASPTLSTGSTQAGVGLREALLESLCHGLAYHNRTQGSPQKTRQNVPPSLQP